MKINLDGLTAIFGEKVAEDSTGLVGKITDIFPCDQTGSKSDASFSKTKRVRVEIKYADGQNLDGDPVEGDFKVLHNTEHNGEYQRLLNAYGVRIPVDLGGKPIIGEYNHAGGTWTLGNIIPIPTDDIQHGALGWVMEYAMITARNSNILVIDNIVKSKDNAVRQGIKISSSVTATNQDLSDAVSEQLKQIAAFRKYAPPALVKALGTQLSEYEQSARQYLTPGS